MLVQKVVITGAECGHYIRSLGGFIRIIIYSPVGGCVGTGRTSGLNLVLSSRFWSLVTLCENVALAGSYGLWRASLGGGLCFSHHFCGRACLSRYGLTRADLRVLCPCQF